MTVFITDFHLACWRGFCEAKVLLNRLPPTCVVCGDFNLPKARRQTPRLKEAGAHVFPFQCGVWVSALAKLGDKKQREVLFVALAKASNLYALMLEQGFVDALQQGSPKTFLSQAMMGIFQT